MEGVARAEETVVWWDFLGGGDGARMKKLIEDFNTDAYYGGKGFGFVHLNQLALEHLLGAR